MQNSYVGALVHTPYIAVATYLLERSQGPSKNAHSRIDLDVILPDSQDESLISNAPASGTCDFDIDDLSLDLSE
jgi:hypothetical protein